MISQELVKNIWEYWEKRGDNIDSSISELDIIINQAVKSWHLWVDKASLWWYYLCLFYYHDKSWELCKNIISKFQESWAAFINLINVFLFKIFLLLSVISISSSKSLLFYQFKSP